MLPLYEGKMIYHFDHRFGDYRYREQGRVDSVLPRTQDSAKSIRTSWCCLFTGSQIRYPQ